MARFLAADHYLAGLREGVKIGVMVTCVRLLKGFRQYGIGKDARVIVATIYKAYRQERTDAG
jgi:hypothetical protein